LEIKGCLKRLKRLNELETRGIIKLHVLNNFKIIAMPLHIVKNRSGIMNRGVECDEDNKIS
jgi:hypothetical protein